MAGHIPRSNQLDMFPRPDAEDYSSLDNVFQPQSKVGQEIHKALLLPEIQAIIFQYLSVQEKCRVALACRAWCKGVEQPSVWSNVVATLRPRKNSVPWKCLARRNIRRVKLLEPDSDDCWGLFSVTREIIHLERLDLSEYDNVSEKVLVESFDMSLPNLTHLNLSGCGFVTDQVVIAITDCMVNLVSLNLNFCFRLTDNALLSVANKMTALKHINLSNCSLITDEGVGYMLEPQCVPLLESLELADCNALTNQTLLHVSTGKPKIRTLNMGFYRKSASLEPGHLNALRWQDLTFESMIGDDGLLELARRDCNVTILSLCGCHLVSDMGLRHVSQLKQLTDLDLSFCINVTDRGLDHLMTMANLRNLDISFCPCISDEDTVKLAHLKKLTRRGTSHLW